MTAISILAKSMTSEPTTVVFTNCRQCINGTLINAPLAVGPNGYIIPYADADPTGTRIDMKNAILAPGFLELQINGALGFHFAHEKVPEVYQAGVKKLARYLPSTGVTGFYPTVPTVSPEIFRKVLPFLKPEDSPNCASVLGAHVEGPFLAPSRKGAHDAANMHLPVSSSLEDIYGKENIQASIRIMTMAPELPDALKHIETLTKDYGVHVSMGHSAASYEQGMAGLEAGANLITHTFNAMNPLHHREPGIAGLISNPKPPYFSLIADEIHLHPSIVRIAYRSSPSHCILVTDSIELSGLPDGIHPGHAQIPFNQFKLGNRVTIEGTNTLIGTCIELDECVKNMMTWLQAPIEEAVMCVTENVANAMSLNDRGRLEVGRRGDFVVLREDGTVQETWMLGKMVHSYDDNKLPRW